eukprot:3519228-Amphidinium_carterae.1
MSESGFDPDRHAALLAATSSSSAEAFPRLPWEEDWIAPLFDLGSLPWEHSWSSTALSSVQVLPPSLSEQPVEESVHACERPPKRSRKHKGFSGWLVTDQRDKNAELLCWVDIAFSLGDSSKVTQQMRVMSSSGASKWELAKFLAVITSDREVSTLARHRSSLNQMKRQSGVLVPSEEEFFRYLSQMLEHDSPKTWAVSILKALLFLQHVFEVTVLREVTASRRVLGTVVACKKRGSAVEHKDALPVRVVEALEYRVVDAAVDTQERLMAGLIL